MVGHLRTGHATVARREEETDSPRAELLKLNVDALRIGEGNAALIVSVPSGERPPAIKIHEVRNKSLWQKDGSG